MKLLYSWLNDYVSTSTPPQDLADELSMLGFEVEDVSVQTLDYPGLVVGRVTEVSKHPQADKLSLCMVDIGVADGPLQIVCGASNVAAGQLVPVATVGTVLPGNFKIRKSKIRGQLSRGMICSESELGVGEDASGIWVLSGDLQVGQPLSEALNHQPDSILDIFITPNRPDAMSIIGLAREVAANEDKKLTLPEAQIEESGAPTGSQVKVTIDCPQDCPRYAARLIRNVTIGPSPSWLANRLQACGVRPINNIVDITNYVLLETGQPLHAFDYDLLAGGHINVRLSEPDEKFVTLDQKERVLSERTVLICDAEKPVALGGIMGGLNSEVSEKTVNVLLESAYFSPDSIRRGNKPLGILSEASQRFARGVDPRSVLYAQDRAAALMQELAAGQIAPGIVDVYPVAIEPRRLKLDVQRINDLLGTALSAAEMLKLLAKIEIAEATGELVLPTFRPDLQLTADIAEEVARLYGYNSIPDAEVSQLPYGSHRPGINEFVAALHNHMVGMGYQEVSTTSMVNGKAWHRMTGESLLPIVNPISLDMDAMRNSLVPSLLNVLLWNNNRQDPNLAIYEIGRTFHKTEQANQLPVEQRKLTIALCGIRDGGTWYSGTQPIDYYDIKGAVEGLLNKISLDNISFIPYDNFAVGEGQSVKILHGKTMIGFLGKTHHELAKRLDLDFPVFVAELDIDELFRSSQTDFTLSDIPKFPAVERDLALIVDRHVQAADVHKKICQHAGNFLVESRIFDVYMGKQVSQGRKSLAFRLTFRSVDRTLTESDIAPSIDRVLDALKKEFGAELRS